MKDDVIKTKVIGQRTSTFAILARVADPAESACVFAKTDFATDNLLPRLEYLSSYKDRTFKRV